MPKDPLLRAMTVIIVGTIAFGLLFYLFIGGGNMDHMGDMGGGGYGYSSLGGLLGGLLVLLIKLLLVVLVIAVVIGVIIWIKNTFFKNSTTGTKFAQSLNNDPILKTVVYVTLGIVGLVIIFALIGSLTTQGMGYGYGMSGEGMAGGVLTGVSLAAIMVLLVKVLLFVLVISLILALVAYVKKLYDSGALNKAAGTQANTQANTQSGAQTDTAKAE